MAGQPKKQKMLAELERLTRAEFDDEQATHLDFAEQWIASGNTILSLARKLSLEIGLEVHREALSKYLASLELSRDRQGTVSRARARGGHALAERAIDISENATVDDVQVSALRVRSLQWLAERWNAQELGQSKGTSVVVNFGALMLEALRQPIPVRTVITGDIAQDAELLSADVTMTYDSEQRTMGPLRITSGDDRAEAYTAPAAGES